MGKGASKEAADEIPAGLNATILQQVPEDVKEKIIIEYKEYKSRYDDLETSSENYRVNAEQRFFELEKNLTSSNESLGVESKAAYDLRQTVTTIEGKLKDVSRELEETKARNEEAEQIIRDLESSRCNLEVEKTDLSQALDRKKHEIDRLNEEWREMSEKLKKSNEERLDAMVKKDDMATQMNSAIHREQRLAQENSQLQHQKDWFDQELKNKVNELLSIRKEQSSNSLELEAQLEQKSEEVAHLEELVVSLKANIQDLSSRSDSYCEKIKESKDMHMQMDEQHRTQMHSQNKLTELYKEAASDTESQVKELTSAVSELQRLLKEATDAYTGLEKQKDDEIQAHKEVIHDKENDICRMNDELKNANELLEVAKAKGQMRLNDEAIEALSPSAAAASRLLRSGMTLTQIYGEYVRVSDELTNEKQERERLSQNLDTILEEIEQKAPVFKRQREQYEAIHGVVDQLTRQLDTARVEQEKLQVDSDEEKRRAMHLTRENQRLRQQTVDLGQQVRMLLKELEEARGRVVTNDMDTSIHNISSDEVSSSSQIISERLVTFRGIEELQMKNQDLLAALRNLSDEKEEAEKQALDERSAELKRQLETVTDELEMMQSSRDRQASMVESVVRQRDMYRVLLAESGAVPHIPPSPIPQTSTPVPPNRSTSMITSETPDQMTPQRSSSPTYEKKMLEEKTAALKDLMEEFNTYREEKRKNVKILTDQIENQRQTVSDAKVQNAKLASQLDYQGERIKVLQSNAESYRKETDALRDKNQKYAAAVIRNEQTITSLKDDLMAVNERLSRAEIIAENMRVERNMLKSVEARLLQEKENALREQNTQKILLTNLQAIQNNLERSDFENKTRLNNRIEMLDKENIGLRNKLDTIDTTHREAVTRVERQLAESKNECERALKLKREAYEPLHAKEKEVELLQQKISNLQSELEKRQSSPAQPLQAAAVAMPSSVTEEEIKDLKAQLNASRIEINNLNAKLEAERSHKEQYQNIATSIETTLKEQSETNQHFKETAESQLTETRQANVQLQRKLDLTEHERQKLLDENFKLEGDLQKNNSDLQKQLQIIQGELEEAVSRRETAIANEQEARRDLANQSRMAQEARDKYERELILHAADVEVLTNIKKEQEAYTKRLAQAEEAAKEAKTTLDAYQEGWTGREKLLKNEENILKQRISELQEQNNVLHQELDAMAAQYKKIQYHQEKDEQERATMADNVQSDATGERPQEQLMEVIRFIRKEKDIALAKFEVAEAECARLKHRLDYTEKQLKETSEALSVERQNIQVQMSSAAQHVDLMRKVDQLNLTTESNKLLRQERDQLAIHLKAVETKANKLEEDINPLQENNRELTAERDSLSTEKTALLAEVERWRARTNHLIEQCNKTDPEEYKRLLKERELSRKQLVNQQEEINKLRAEVAKIKPELARAEYERDNLKRQHNIILEENHKIKAEASRTVALISKNEAEIANLKTSVEKLTTERDATKQALAVKTKEDDAKSRTITQLKNVARKYKKESADATAKLNAQAPNIRVTQLEEKLKKTEEDRDLMTERLGSADVEKNEASNKVKELEAETNAFRSELEKSKEDLGRAKANETALDTVNKSLQDQITKLQEETKKNTNVMLMRAKTKIKSQNEGMEKMKIEISELQQKLEAAQKESSAQKAATESRIASLEKDLSQAQSLAGQPETQKDSLISQLQQKNTALQKQVAALQKQVDTQQKTSPPSGAQKSAPGERERSSGPTANIRPITAPSTSSRQVPVQPVRNTGADTRETRAMASIRPMVGAPTPTATVMPTTVAVHEEMASPSQVRPTPPVQPVSPHIEPDTQSSNEPVEPEVTETVIVQPPAPEPTPSTSTGRDTTPAPSRDTTPAPSRDTSSSSGANKRSRDEGEGSDMEQETIKRPKTQEPEVVEAEDQSMSQDAGPPQAEVEALQPEPREETVQVGVVEPQEPTVVQAPVPDTTTEATPVEMRARPETPATGDDDQDAIIVDDDSEEPEVEDYDEGEEGYDDDEGEDVDVEEEEDAENEDEMEEEYPEDVEDGEGEEEGEGEYEVIPDEDYQGGEEGEEDENEVEEEEMEEEYEEDEGEEALSGNEGSGTQDAVVIVDDDEEEEAVEDQSASSVPSQEPEQAAPVEQPSGSQVAPQVSGRVQPARFAPRSTVTARAQQLQPFMLGTNQFEDGDDSIVPSTPTLLQPKTGTDGFQVAISSPQVPQGRFLFSSGTPQEALGAVPSQSDLAQLASQEGVDSSCMDLSQFDDSTNRSVPTTPLSHTPPTISITEAPPIQEEDAPPTSTEDPPNSAQAERQSDVPETEVEVQVSEEDTPAEETVTPSTSQAEETVGDGGAGDEGDGSQSQEDKPSSSGATGDKLDQGGANKPKKIQRIVWDQPVGSPATTTTQPPTAAPSPSQPVRKFGRGALRGTRGQPVPHRGGPHMHAQQQGHPPQFYRGPMQMQGGNMGSPNMRGTISATRTRPMRGQRSRRSRPF